MVLVAVILLVVAIVALSVGMFFVKNKSLHSVLFVMSILCLVALGVTCGAYLNKFGGNLIFLIVSPIPLTLNLVSLTNEGSEIEIVDAPASPETPQDAPSEENSSAEEASEASKTGKKGKIRSKLKEVNLSACLHGVGALICSVCVIFSAMYIGIESAYGALAGLVLGLGVTFLKMGLRKEKSLSAFLNDFLFAVSAGLAFCGGLCAVFYAFSFQSVLFFLGTVVLATYFLFRIFVKEDAKNAQILLKIQNAVLVPLAYILLLLSTLA